jgi:hypothetical protein
VHIVPGSPRGCVAYAGVALALGARFTTCASLCRSRSGACPTWVRGLCRGCARPLGSLHRLPTLCRPFHGLIPRVMLGCRGCARPVALLHRLPTLCRPFHGLIPQGMLGCRGFAPPEGVAPPPAYTVPPVSRANPAGDVGLQGLRTAPWRRCAAPVRELAPRGCVAETGVSLRPRASLHRLPTLCRPFHGLKLCLCPWWRGGEDTLKIFFRVIYC